MRKTPEGEVKKRITAALKRLGPDRCWYVMPVMGELGTVGIPDYLCCIDGRFLAIEAKRGKALVPTTRQQFRIEDIQRAGGKALVINVENIRAFEVWMHELQSDHIVH